MFWIEKSRTQWHSDGDMNTSYFHTIAKIKDSKTNITFLMNNDIFIMDHVEMVDHTVSYFTDLFCFAGTSFDNSIIYDMIPSLVDSSMNNFLTSIPSAEEIKVVVFNLNKTSAHGPDDFRGFF
ncbi:unnamed protein product [Lathyrus sativus]|nr:unnamed protein product [Lathyrus sativus]